MPKKRTLKKSFFQAHGLRIAIGVSVLLLIVGAVSTVALIKSKEFIFDVAITQSVSEPETVLPQVISFPIGVNPAKQLITENPSVDSYLQTQISYIPKNDTHVSWFDHAIARLAQMDWYQNLASPLSRILVIESGERKEQVIDNFGDILRWDSHERTIFGNLVASSSPQISEGKFFPGRYVVTTEATPEEVAKMLIDAFDTEVASRYTSDIETLVPLTDTLTIASLLEREAYDFEDMRYISGVIWNRLFIDMNLQLDASLQYAKANETNAAWWPVVRPEDKYVESPFNTYANPGLPPSPIANPSTAAILAALNPKETECIFYFHDKDGGFHCTKTYEEHVALLKEYYGRGK